MSCDLFVMIAYFLLCLLVFLCLLLIVCERILFAVQSGTWEKATFPYPGLSFDKWALYAHICVRDYGLLAEVGSTMFDLHLSESCD